jgi:uncharacterized membrane protein
MTELAKRSLVKTLTWRVTGSSAVFVIGWALTGNVGMAGAIAIAQIIINTILYFIHERVWNQISWGRIS